MIKNNKKLIIGLITGFILGAVTVITFPAGSHEKTGEDTKILQNILTELKEINKNSGILVKQGNEISKGIQTMAERGSFIPTEKK